ncbi:hypothetical protein NP493_628g01036 [Ridgeia piscesae]|uniref:Uncharacterized protein n=1 Tax=Ridgeia piscesae TaxID=27915 RepID=A0AAD9KTA9_RIDPI|nr:hypothetical protein NP493_628g01036 [Ridgeia piscesae]
MVLWTQHIALTVTKVLGGVRSLGAVPDVRLPVTLPVLSRLVHALPALFSSRYKCLMLRAMMVLAFKVYLRICKMVPRSRSMVRGCLHVDVNKLKTPTYRRHQPTEDTNLPKTPTYRRHQPTEDTNLPKTPTYRRHQPTEDTNLPKTPTYRRHQPTEDTNLPKTPTYRRHQPTEDTNLPKTPTYRRHQPTEDTNLPVASCVVFLANMAPPKKQLDMGSIAQSFKQ